MEIGIAGESIVAGKIGSEVIAQPTILTVIRPRPRRTRNRVALRNPALQKRNAPTSLARPVHAVEIVVVIAVAIAAGVGATDRGNKRANGINSGA